LRAQGLHHPTLLLLLPAFIDFLATRVFPER
jgi:hypothetical protein